MNAACVDALTILVQDWRAFSQKALGISIGHVAICLATFALFFVPGFVFFKDMGLNMLPWLGVAFFLTLTVKIAFYDSYVLAKTVCAFLDLAGQSKIESRNYAKLDKWSKEYAKLRASAEKAAEKAEDEAEKAAKKAAKAAKAEEKAAKAEDKSDKAEESSAEEVKPEDSKSEEVAESQAAPADEVKDAGSSDAEASESSEQA